MNNYFTHQPFLKHYIEKTSGDILEFGVGYGSTEFILNLIKDTDRKLYSFENDLDWFNKISSEFPPNKNHIYHFVNDWDDFLSTFPKKNKDAERFSIVFLKKIKTQSGFLLFSLTKLLGLLGFQL